MMHVLIGEGLVDHEYIHRATLGYGPLAQHVKQYDPERVAAITGLTPEAIVGFARRYGATKASFLRVGIGLSRHDNGGGTCRAIACLPALTGAYAHPSGGALLSSTRAFGLDWPPSSGATSCPRPQPRTINMIRLGRALTDPGMSPPVKALYVYNSNPASVVPNQELVLRGLAREDLFTVVHEQHLTDTTDYADIVLPATTSMEHVDLYKSFGHLYVQLAEPVIEPVGESRSNWQVVRLLARAMGLADRALLQGRARAHPGGAGVRRPVGRGHHLRAAEGGAFRAAQRRPAVPAVRRRGADALGQGRVRLRVAWPAQGLPSLPTCVPLVEGPENEALARRYPAPVHRAAQPLLPELVLQPVGHAAAPPAGALGLPPPGGRAAARHRGRRRRRGAERPRGGAVHRDLTDDTRPGLAVIEGIWWSKHQAGGRGVNVITDDRLGRHGRGPALHSNLVQVARL